MAVRFYDKVYVRAAGTVFTTIAKSALSSFTKIPSTMKVTQELTLKTETDVSTPMGDGSEQVGSEAGTLELQLINVNPADITTIRSNLINQRVDVVVYDSNASTAGYAMFGVQLYPAPEIASGKEAVIKLTGKKRYPADMTPALTPITLT